MATRKRKNRSDMSELARAASERGGMARDQIASSVIDRIVQNSSEDFQRFLSSQSGSDAMAAAQSMSAPVQPAPPAPPVEAAIPVTASASPLPPAPALMPSFAPQAAPMASVLPPPPVLYPGVGMQSEQERLLRQLGLL